jgi:hypothetical protein
VTGSISTPVGISAICGLSVVMVAIVSPTPSG